MKKRICTLAVAALAGTALFAKEVELHADACSVADGETPIGALVAVHDRIETLWAADTGTVVRLFPFSLDNPKTAARNRIANREMQFFTYKEPRVVWFDAKAKLPGTDGYSKIWARRGTRNEPWWYDRMKSIHEKIKSSGGEFDIVYLGDSITHDLERPPGIKVWKDLQRTYSMLNLGYGGDGCRPALWRAKNGELDGYRAKVVSVLIGTNDRGDPPEKVAGWVGEILTVIREKQPQAKIILMPMLPRAEPAHVKLREKNDAASGLYRRYVDDRNVFWCDIRSSFVWPDGRGNYSLLSDGTHPSTSGHRIWRDAMLPYFERFTGKRHVPNDPKVVPYARRWIAVKADLGAADSTAAALALVERAKKLGFNGICLDADFDSCAMWDKARCAALKTVAGRFKEEGMTLVPVMHCAEEQAFVPAAKALEKLASPEKWMVFTNAVSSAATLKSQLCSSAKTIASIHPGAEALLWAYPMSGGTGDLDRKSVTFVCGGWSFGHALVSRDYHAKGWRAMVAPVCNHPKYLMHYPFYSLKDYVGESGADGVIYWTDIGDYEWLDDFADLMKRKE